MAALARTSCPPLRSGRAFFSTGVALVLCMNLVEMRNVLGAWIVTGIDPPEGLQRLLDYADALGRLPVHVLLAARSTPGTNTARAALARDARFI